jgi:nicotinate-nucleotide adenylyltransferase
VKKRIAFYGGSFDPVHDGHIAVARGLIDQFSLDWFVFIPAFHAPHKPHRTPTSAYHRYAMLSIATNDLNNVSVSTMEIDLPEKPYTVETLTRINEEHPDDSIFFVMGADSWMDITTWREWEKVLTMANQIVVTRPGVEIGFDHVSEVIRSRIIDLRQDGKKRSNTEEKSVYITDAIQFDVSATEIRERIQAGGPERFSELPIEVAKYIEKYQIYK